MIKFKIIKGIDGYNQAKDFREKILKDEMKFPEFSDDKEDMAFHIIGRENDEVMCYGRLYKIGEYVFSIDKVCVKKEDRMQYVGDTILRALEDKAVGEIASLIKVEAPESAWEFFEHEDYVAVDEAYSENNIKYKKMKKDLTKVRGCRGGCHK